MILILGPLLLAGILALVISGYSTALRGSRTGPFLARHPLLPGMVLPTLLVLVPALVMLYLGMVTEAVLWSMVYVNALLAFAIAAGRRRTD
ncbi:hypothetical protein ACFQ07_10970 [Actinomadura adrarensis]|uniref:Uncharacterized protein n=1 Tax=Actinomadura adrarensis TaxID=1819600 RepID=A0ABW3CFP0_9ACTN